MSKIPFYDLKPVHSLLESGFLEDFREVLGSGAFIGSESNPFSKRFEEAFSQFTGSNFCIGCSNGTDALEIALQALSLKPGQEVLVPAMTWFSTPEAVLRQGGSVKFVDVEPETGLIDLQKLESSITGKTVGVIPVHLYGSPVNMPELMRIARKFNLFVIEDCAQAQGAMVNENHVGSFGDIGCFSFYPGKNLGALGDAGGLICQDESLKEKIRWIIDHGQSEKHNHRLIGRNARLDGLQAAFLKRKLTYLEEWNKDRRRIARKYLDQLKNESLQLPRLIEGSYQVFHLFVILSEARDGLAEYLKKNDVMSSIHYPTYLPGLELLGSHSMTEFPKAFKIAKNCLSLPLYPGMPSNDQDRVIEILNKWNTD